MEGALQEPEATEEVATARSPFARLCGIFFLSGAAALVFENLWFHQAGLTLGNSVWASSLVLAAFMAGLAVGNAFAARWGERLANPVRAYGLLELVVASSGLVLVVGLPSLAPFLGGAVGPLIDEPWLLNPLRLSVAFFLLLLPSSAMGATLPLLVRALSAHDTHFGRVLGGLYGWNTLGAVAGTVLAEVVLVETFGIRGSGLVAALLACVAAALALSLAGRTRPIPPVDAKATTSKPLSVDAGRLLGVAFLCGFALLALEVVWFRFLLLFLPGTTLAFALMLAVVLAAIGIGGLLASAWLRRVPDAIGVLAPLVWCAGVGVVVTYIAFSGALDLAGASYLKSWQDLVLLGVALMAPVALVSGVAFTLVGAALQAELSAEARTTGWLALANTSGAALGPLVAGFVLLPSWGMERSFLGLAALYGVAGLLVPGLPARTGSRLGMRLTAAGALLLALVLFPLGSLEGHYLHRSVGRFLRGDSEVQVVREGLTDTLVYVRTKRFGETYYHRLLTNGFSMTASTTFARRYMKLYAYWPVALHPQPRRALLISYGVGMTAGALTDTRELERIDVVDISRDILELSSVVHAEAGQNPLDDPRVHVHVEDGRHFLQTTDLRFDLITGEPPPPKMAGVVNLYTREYFELMRERLAPGGIVTYWLPVRGLTPDDSRAILRGFCDAFDDCSLWLGTTFDWMMVGSRGLEGPTPVEHFERQWRDPHVAPQLRALGFETPAQIGTTFLADAAQVATFVGDTAPLVDDWPRRLSVAPPAPGIHPVYDAWIDADAARERFEQSDLVAGLWPPELRKASLAEFDIQDVVNEAVIPRADGPLLPKLHRLLTESSLSTPPLWLLGSDALESAIVKRARARRLRGPILSYRAGLGALASREYGRAASLFAEARRRGLKQDAALRLGVYALCMAERREEAATLAASAAPAAELDEHERDDWRWLEETFGVGRGASGSRSANQSTDQSARASAGRDQGQEVPFRQDAHEPIAFDHR